MKIAIYHTSLGGIKIGYKNDKIILIAFINSSDYSLKNIPSPLTHLAITQITEYIDGDRKSFDLPISIEGSDFQLRVWNALRQIPYGETRSYKDIACAIGNPKTSRAVGMANNKNPLLFVIPCHRVVGTNGSVVGYAGGIDRKIALLELEKRQADKR